MVKQQNTPYDLARDGFRLKLLKAVSKALLTACRESIFEWYFFCKKAIFSGSVELIGGVFH